jgi:hypothetical protein
MRFLTLVLVLLLSFNSVEAYTFLYITGSSVKYNLDQDDLVINIEHFPSHKKSGKYITNKNKALSIIFTNIPEGISSTRLIIPANSPYPFGYLLNANNKVRFLFEATNPVRNSSSTHKIVISGLRAAGALSTLNLELLDESDTVVDTKVVRINSFMHLPGSSSFGGCGAIATCGEYQFENEDKFYKLQGCGIDGSTSVDLDFCEETVDE